MSLLFNGLFKLIISLFLIVYKLNHLITDLLNLIIHLITDLLNLIIHVITDLLNLNIHLISLFLIG